jgi:hypothetical protein
MNNLVGIVFAVAAVVLTLMFFYCIWMALTVGLSWLFVSIGILMPDMLCIVIAIILLRVAP